MFATIIRWYRIAFVPHRQFNLFSTFDESLSVLGASLWFTRAI